MDTDTRFPEGRAGEILAKVDWAKRRRSRRERDWIENVRMLNGLFYGDVDPTMDRIAVNMFWSTAKSVVPSIYFRNPEVIVTAKRPQDEDTAPVLEAALNHWVKRIGTKRVIQKMIVDGLCYPWAVCKLGYLLDRSMAHVATNQQTGESRIIEHSEPIDLTEFKIEDRPVFLGDRPYLTRVSPRCFHIDPKATDLEDAEWVCEEIVRHLDDVKEDPLYQNTDELKPTARYRPSEWPAGHQYYGVEQQDLDHPSAGGPFDEDIASTRDRSDEDALVILYEFWDRRERRLYVVSPGSKDLLRADEWPYDFENYPYYQLVLGVAVPDEPYPIPLLSVFKPQQLELNKIRSYQLDFIKRSVTKYAVDAAMTDKNTIDAFRRGERVPLVECKGKPSEIFLALPGAEMNPEVLRAEMACKDDIRMMTGLAEFQRATVAPGGATATEQKLIAASVSAGVEFLRDQVADVVRDVCVGLKDLLQQFADKPTMVKMTGRADFPWRQFTRDDIAGEYDVDIRAGSQLPIDREVRIHQALQLFNLFAPIAMQGGPVAFEPLAREVLEAFGTVNIDRILKAPDADKAPIDPVSEEGLFEQDGIAHAGPNDDHQFHISVHTPKLQAEQDPQRRYRRLAHIRQHYQMMVQQQMASIQGGQQPGGPAAGPPGGGPPSMGQGRGPTSPGFPMAPRQFSEKPPRPGGIERAATRRMSP